VKWEAWPFQGDLLRVFSQHPDVVILKARQLGISWLVAGYCLHQAVFNESAKIMYFSQGEKEAWEMVCKSKFIWEHLPPFLKPALGQDSARKMEFSNLNSVLEAQPSTSKAGRSTDATIVVRDELAYHEKADDNFSAIGPTIDAGGQLIDLSTIDKDALDNHFGRRVNRARTGAEKKVLPSGVELYTGGEGNSVLTFLSWKLRPTRQEGMSLEEWFELKVKPKYSDYEIEKEYPASIEEAMRPSQAQGYFDVEALYGMKSLVTNPIKVEDFDTRNGLINVYKKPVVGRKYVLFTDPSNGITDPFASVVIDWATGEEVASVNAKMSAREVARIHDSLARYYGAYHSGEVNAPSGGTFMDTIDELGTPNLAPRRTPDGKIINEKKGWYTTEPLRDRALNDLRDGVHDQSVTIHTADAISEFESFIMPEGGTKPRAMGGAHDDWVMAWAGVWQIRKYLPLGEFKITSTKYKG